MFSISIALGALCVGLVPWPADGAECGPTGMNTFVHTRDTCTECRYNLGRPFVVASASHCEAKCANVVEEGICYSAIYSIYTNQCWLNSVKLKDMDEGLVVKDKNYIAFERCGRGTEVVVPEAPLDCVAPTLFIIDSTKDLCTDCTLPDGARSGVNSLAQCRLLCTQNSRCMAATYWEEYQKCWLKDRRLDEMGLSGLVPTDEFVPISRCPTNELPPTFSNCMYPDFGEMAGVADRCTDCTIRVHTDIESAQHCRAVCLLEHDCEAISYWIEQRKCYLKDRPFTDLDPSQIVATSAFVSMTRCQKEATVLPEQPRSCRAPNFYPMRNFRDYCAKCTLPNGVVSNVPDVTVCEAKCATTSGCMMALYHSGDKMCFLKNKRLHELESNQVGSASDLWTAISMCRVSILPLPPPGCHWPFFQIMPQIKDTCIECQLEHGIVEEVDTVDECRELCSLTPGCQAASYSQRSRHCYLKDRRLEEMAPDQVSAAHSSLTAIQRCPCPGCAYPDFESFPGFKTSAGGYRNGMIRELDNVDECMDKCVERKNCEAVSFLSLKGAEAKALEDESNSEPQSQCIMFDRPIQEQYPYSEVQRIPHWEILSRCQCDAPARGYHAPPLRCDKVYSKPVSSTITAQPSYISFYSVDVHSFSDTQAIKLSAIEGKVRIVKVRCKDINRSFKLDLSPLLLGKEKKHCLPKSEAIYVSLDLPASLDVQFNPKAKGVYTAHLEFLDAADNVLTVVTVVGIGGEAFVGEHFAHPVMESERVYIALPGEATAQVLMQGRGSHTHERRSLMDYMWTHLNSGRAIVEMDFQCKHDLGVHGYHLTVTDNHRAHESDVISFEVAPADRVPGTLLRFFSTEEDSPDGKAVWSSLQISSFSATAGHFGDSTGTIIGFTGTFLWPRGTQKLTWEGCEGGSVSILVGGVPVVLKKYSADVSVQGYQELHFSCQHHSVATVQVLLNGDTIPNPHFSVLDLRPTVNKLISSNLTRPGAEGSLHGFYFGDAIVKLEKGDITRTPEILGRTERGIRFTYPPGEEVPDGQWSVYVVRGDLESNRVDINIMANAPLAPAFKQHKLTPTVPQSAATVYCHGKLYVANVWDGFIYEYQLNDDNEVTDWQTDVKLVTSIPHEVRETADEPGVSASILGMVCDPFETDDDYKIYFTRNQLFRNPIDGEEYWEDGKNYTVWTIPDKVYYTSKISYAEPHASNCVGVTNFFYDENPSVCKLAPVHDVVVNLPCSNYDHAQNCMAFTHERTLLLCSGSSTNAGIANPSLKSLTESPLSGAIVEINLFAPGFREKDAPHAIQYEWLSNVPKNIRDNQSPDDMRFGMHVKLMDSSAKYIGQRVTGCRNPFGLTVTNKGKIHVTVSGPNDGFGPKLDSADSNGEPLGLDDDFGDRTDPVLLNVPPEGCHMGHANIARCNAGRAEGRKQADILDCTWRSWLENYPGYCAHEDSPATVFELESALGGVLEYNSQVFGGTVSGALYIPSYRGWTWRCPAHTQHGTECVPDAGQGADDLRDRNYPSSPGLAIQHIPGGAHVITEYFRDSVFVNSPDYVAAGPEAWSVHPDRARSTSDGHVRFIISGARLNELNDVKVYFGRELVSVKGYEMNANGSRISGVLPNTASPGLVDVRVTHSTGEIGMPGFFYYLPDSLVTEQ